jgi:hypothetical protein
VIGWKKSSSTRCTLATHTGHAIFLELKDSDAIANLQCKDVVLTIPRNIEDAIAGLKQHLLSLHRSLNDGAAFLTVTEQRTALIISWRSKSTGFT